MAELKNIYELKIEMVPENEEDASNCKTLTGYIASYNDKSAIGICESESGIHDILYGT